MARDPTDREGKTVQELLEETPLPARPASLANRIGIALVGVALIGATIGELLYLID